MVVSELTDALEGLEAQPALLVLENFASRAQALDELEFHVLDRLDGLLATAPSAALSCLRTRALALQTEFEALDDQLFQQLRATIRTGHYTPAGLRALLATYAGPASLDNYPAATSYDGLDVLTNGLFTKLAEPLEAAAREPGMVYYQKTPARIILELAAKLTSQDVFYDLGSGLGQVPLLVRLLSGATAIGVEIEPAYCRYAQVNADALRLTRVHFINADARSVSYADGSAFFLFTPFTGHLLQTVLNQLQQVAQQKPLRLFSYGPGTLALTQQPWLRRLDPPDSHLYQLTEFWSC